MRNCKTYGLQMLCVCDFCIFVTDVHVGRVFG